MLETKGIPAKTGVPFFIGKAPWGKVGEIRNELPSIFLSAPFLTEYATNQYSCGIHRLLNLPGGNLGRSGPMGEKGLGVFLLALPRRLPFPLRPGGQLPREDQHPLLSFGRPSVPGESSSVVRL